jgi:hypothetical protein
MNDRHQQKPYPLRMSEELRKELEAAAGASGRSLNAEIVARLQGSFEGSSSDSDKLALDLSRKVLGLEMMAGSVGAFLKLTLNHLTPAAERKLGGVLPTMHDAADEAYAVGKMSERALADRIGRLLNAGGTTENAHGLIEVIKLLKDSGVDPTPWTDGVNEVKPSS